MKKAPLLITIGIIALIVLGYFSYVKFLVKKETLPWDLVPASAVAVYETSSCPSCTQLVINSPLWTSIREAAFYDKEQDSIKSIIRFFDSPPGGALSSLHVTKKDGFDFVFYIPLKDVNDRKRFELAMDQWKHRNGFRYREHEFNSITIREVASKDAVFSWVILGDVFVGSFTPFLVEDVIRVYGGESEVTFKTQIAGVYQMPKLKNDAGNLYVHLKNFSEWISVFASNADLKAIENFGAAAILDIKAEEKKVVLNGFSQENPQGPSVLSVFDNQSPTSFSIKQYVSNRTVMLASYGISNGESFGKKLDAYPGRSKAVRDTLSQLSKALKVDFDALYKTIHNELGVCYVESGGQRLSKLLLVECDNPDNWINILNAVSEKLSIDTVFYERYSGYEIRELPLFRFPEKIFSPFVKGFDQTYYTVIGNTILLGEDLEQLKYFLEDIDREDTWGKSVAQNKFFESTLLEANISLYINTPRIWNILSPLLEEKWTRFVQDKRTQLSALGMGAIQFSHLNENFYTNVSWLSESPAIADKGREKRVETIVTGFDYPLSEKIFVVKSHVDRSDEVLLQDSVNTIHFVSAKGDELWSLPMNGPIIGDVFQVDYFKNGKLQYFFATPGTLHIIDRLGNYVSPFPLRVPAKDIESISLVDYDHSKNYRFLVADRSGKLWMYDKEGSNLDGWKPRNVGDGLFTVPQHHRIRGKDYLLAIRKDGQVYLMNRRGELLKGFPLNLDARPTGDYFLEIGNSMESTYFVIVSRDGFRIKFNLEGKIKMRETLLKTAIDARFSLVKESSDKSYVMVRQEAKGLTIFNADGKEILSNTFMGMNFVTVHYYDFGAGKIYYTITDAIQDLSYIYDSNGNLLSSPPFESFVMTLRPFNSDNVRVYLTYEKSLYIRPLL